MKVPATRPYFSEDDIKYILERFTDILKGNSFLTMHKYGAEFESRFAEFVGRKFAVACNSGTSALELFCRALNLEGREVIIPSNTFVASANAVINAGAKPVFADVEKSTMCLDAADVENRITERTAAIMQVHIGGIVSESTLDLQKICRERGLHFVEDAAQAHGTELGGIQAGAFGVAAGFSFFSTKVMTTGEGGMVVTDDRAMADRMRSLREFGKVPTDIYVNYYQAMGYNWRLPEVASLMGIRQLASIKEFIRRRQEIGRMYDEALDGLSDITIIRPSGRSYHNYFKYMVLLNSHDRAAVHKALVAEGVQPSGYVYELPLHKQPVFPEYNSLSLPNTELVCARHLCLPIFYGMTDEQVDYVAKTLKSILGG